MLINEAIEALYLQIGSKKDIDIAMCKGVNYPKGLLKWADDWGLQNVLNQLNGSHYSITLCYSDQLLIGSCPISLILNDLFSKSI